VLHVCITILLNCEGLGGGEVEEKKSSCCKKGAITHTHTHTHTVCCPYLLLLFRSNEEEQKEEIKKGLESKVKKKSSTADNFFSRLSARPHSFGVLLQLVDLDIAKKSEKKRIFKSFCFCFLLLLFRREFCG